MAYLGNVPATSFETVRKDRFTGLTGTDVTLSYAVSSVNDILVWVNHVKQDYNDYSVSSTTLTLGGSLVSSDIVEIAYLGRTFQTVNPPAGSVGLSQLSATGTASASTYLRGDNSWGSITVGDNTPAFYAYLNTTQSGLGDDVNTKINIDTEVFDTDSCYDNATNYRFTPTTAGKYFLSGSVHFESDTTSNLRACDLRIYKNGSSVANCTFNLTENMGRSVTPTINIIVDANGTSDYYELYGQLNTNNSGNWKATGYSSSSEIRTFFCGYKLNGV